MKRRLNIFCALVMIILGFSVSQSLIVTSRAFIDGARHGWDSAKDSTELKFEGSNMYSVKLMPRNYAECNDSIYNALSGKYVKAHIHEVTVILEDNPQPLYVLEFICYFLSRICTILAIIWFIRLMAQLNKSHIFCWKNVRLLRWLGGFLVVSFLLNLVPTIADAEVIKYSFIATNYYVHMFDSFSIITLLLGVISFIVAETFAMGLRLQEEQELTI